MGWTGPYYHTIFDDYQDAKTLADELHHPLYESYVVTKFEAISANTFVTDET